ncbi:hypothetical protein CYLTODRAFT_413748 [Cylindrobasidium torrendii FP15055 ss-10]|uniref:Uncharacterized protein n=1 Tax=Cylindrobasidium torrendii FP15055 ss-10 TaxID=1314674 RepID=A0A0D7B102_9AGAR|nr:hypothetical protein CYLTODRAFT_413748 [Cylindrobasidium torrendii FP15055 ss-10]
MPPKKKGRKKLPDDSGISNTALPLATPHATQGSSSSESQALSELNTTTPVSTPYHDGPEDELSADVSVESAHIPDEDTSFEDTGEGLKAKKKTKRKQKNKTSKKTKATTAALEHQDPTRPHIRTLSELQKPFSDLIKRLVKEWSYKPDRSIDTNAFLRPGGAWQYSHVFARNHDPFLLLWRIAKALAFIADVDSWMNINQRDAASHKAVDSREEAQCPTLGDIEALIEHCENNKRLVAEGKKPISIFEASVGFVRELAGFEAGTIFKYLVANFGRRGDVPFYATEDGSDLNFAMFILELTDDNASSSARIQYTQGHPAFVIPALLCTLRWHVIQDEQFFTKECLSGDVKVGCATVYGYAIKRGWFLPATQEEIAELIDVGVLKSATCRKARFFQGITKGKTKPFFFKPPPYKPSHRRNVTVDASSQPRRQSLGVLVRTAVTSSQPSQPTRPVTPTQPSRKRAPESPDGGSPSHPPWKQARLREHPSVLPNGGREKGEYTARYVSELALRAQNLSSDRPIRPQFKRVCIDGEDAWVLPEEWIKNPPANAYAPVEFSIAMSLYPCQTVAAPVDDAPDNAVAGPGPSTIAAMTLRNGKRTKA